MAKVFAPWMDAEIVHHIMTALDDNTLELYLKRVEEGAASITFNWHYKTNSNIYVPPAMGKTSADTTQMWSDFFDVKPQGIPAHRAIAEAINFHRSKTPSMDKNLLKAAQAIAFVAQGFKLDVEKLRERLQSTKDPYGYGLNAMQFNNQEQFNKFVSTLKLLNADLRIAHAKAYELMIEYLELDPLVRKLIETHTDIEAFAKARTNNEPFNWNRKENTHRDSTADLGELWKNWCRRPGAEPGKNNTVPLGHALTAALKFSPFTNHDDGAITVDLTNALTTTTTNEDTTVTTTVAPVTIENVTYVTVDGNRVDVSKISVETIFSYIEKAEAEIERLNKLKARPKALERRIEELTNGIQALVAAADAREAA